MIIYVLGWKKFVKWNAGSWYKHGLEWLTSDNKLFVILYEQLKDDVRGTIQKSCDFLHLKTNASILNCVVGHQEGSYHRKTTDNQPDLLVFTDSVTEQINSYQNQINWYLKRRCPDLPECLPLSEARLKGAPHI